MIGPVDDRHGMMAEVLVGGVDDRVVSSYERKLKAPVQVNTISIEEEGEHSPQQIQVHWKEEWDD